jgi:hypothetical protein
MEILKEEGHTGSRISSIVRMSVLQLEYLKTLF